MNKFKFSHTDQYGKHVDVSFEAIYIEDIFYQMKCFLQACDYNIDGDIDIVDHHHENNLMQNPERNFSFDNIPNNNWPFGDYDPVKNNTVPKGFEHEHNWETKIAPQTWTETWGSTPIPSLTTADLAAIKPIDLSSITVTDLTTGETCQLSGWSQPNQYPTMAPLTTEQLKAFTMPMPGTAGGATYKWSDKDAY